MILNCFENLYSNLISKIIARPCITIAIVYSISICFGIGWTNLKVETDTANLYAPQNSKAKRDQGWITAIFPEPPWGSRVYVIGTEENQNILTSEVIGYMFDLHDAVEKIDDLGFCYPNPKDNCGKAGVLAYWQWNRTRFEADKDFLSTLSSEDISDCCSLTNSVVQQSVIGGVKNDGNGKIQSAEAFVLDWYIISDEKQEILELEFIQVVRELKFDGINIYPINHYAQVETSEEAVTSELNLAGLSVLLVALFSSFVLSRAHPIKSKGYLGLIDLVNIGLAMLGGFGLVIAFGVPFSFIVNISFYILLGLGVDDAFIICDAVDRQDKNQPHNAIISKGMLSAAPSITLTSMTDFTAFLVGTVNKIPALSAFSLYTAIAIFFEYVIQVTAFPCAVKLDLQRQEQNRCDLVCCMKEDENKTPKCCCVVVPDDPLQPWSQRVVGNWVPKLLLSRLGKCIVVVVTGLFLAGGIYGALNVEVEFYDYWFLPDNHYLKKAVNVQLEYFPDSLTLVNLCTQEASGGYYAAQGQMRELIDQVRNLEFVVDSSVSLNWYDAYLSWVQTQNLTETDVSGLPNSEASFREALQTFLNTIYGKNFQNSVIMDSEGLILGTCIPHYWIVEKASSAFEFNYLKEARKVIANAAPDLNPIVFKHRFVFLEGLMILKAETLKSFGIALAAVFVICLIFLADLKMATIICIFLVMIDTCLFGSIWWINETLNIVTAICLLIALGLSVDYAAHIGHSFSIAEGSRHEKVEKAWKTMGVSIFNGAVSSFAGILALSGTSHYIFRMFFYMLALIVFFGSFFGLIALPVFLSLSCKSWIHPNNECDMSIQVCSRKIETTT